jgi:5-methylcytosine-specific restriction endonuclease McrA
MANFTKEQIKAAWEKATVVPGDAEKGKVWRKDLAGAWIKFDQYGEETKYGWQVDHAFPKSLGGGEENENLRAMHRENNASKADDFPSYTTVVSSNGQENIEKEEKWAFKKEYIERLKELYPNNQHLKKLAA